MLKLKHIIIFVLGLTSNALMSSNDNEYWKDFETHYKQGNVKNLVEYVGHLSDTHTINSLENLDFRLNALVYFFSTGGKYGFRETPATGEEEKTLKHSLFFLGAQLGRECYINLISNGQKYIDKDEAPKSLLKGHHTYVDAARNNTNLKNHIMSCERLIAAASYVVCFPDFTDLYKDMAVLGFNRYGADFLRLNNPDAFEKFKKTEMFNVSDIQICLDDIFSALTEEVDKEAVAIRNAIFVQKIQGDQKKRYQFDHMDSDIKKMFQRSPLFKTSREFESERKNVEDIAAIVTCKGGMTVTLFKNGGTRMVMSGGFFSGSLSIGKSKSLEENIQELRNKVGVISVERF